MMLNDLGEARERNARRKSRLAGSPRGRVLVILPYKLNRRVLRRLSVISTCYHNTENDFYIKMSFSYDNMHAGVTF